MESVVVLVEPPVALRGIGGRLRGITGRFHGITGRDPGLSGRKTLEMVVGFSGLGGRIFLDYATDLALGKGFAYATQKPFDLVRGKIPSKFL